MPVYYSSIWKKSPSELLPLSQLVDKIMVDVGDMKVGDVIKVKDLAIAQDKDVDLKTDLEAAVVSVAAVHVDPALELKKRLLPKKKLNNIISLLTFIQVRSSVPEFFLPEY